MYMRIQQSIIKLLPRSLQKQLPKMATVIKISEEESRILNHRYRRSNRAANVLSFRYGPDYGEILVCPSVIRREAKEQESSYRYQLTWMILHGMIHLAGRHHEGSRKRAEVVVRLESRILGQIFSTLKSEI